MLLFLIGALTGLNAQYANTNLVIKHSDPQIEDLVELHIAYNEAFPLIDGYRIQLVMRAGNTALDEVNEIKTTFRRKSSRD